MKRSATADQSLERLRSTLPLPAAAALHRLLVRGDDPGGMLLEAWVDVLLRSLAALLLADYLRGTPEPQVEEALRALHRPSMGQWVQTVRSLVDALGKRRQPRPFLEGLSDAFARSKPGEESLLDLLNSLPYWRNLLRKSLASCPTKSAEAAEQLRDRAAKLAQSTTWLNEYRLFRVVKAEPTADGGFSGRVQFLQGHEESPLPVHATWRGHLVCGPVYLENPHRGDALQVSPLVQVTTGPSNSERHFLLKDAPSLNRLRLMHDATAEAVSFELRADSKEDWLSELRYQIPLVHDLHFPAADRTFLPHHAPSLPTSEQRRPLPGTRHEAKGPKPLLGLEVEETIAERGPPQRSRRVRLRFLNLTLVEWASTVALGLVMTTVGIHLYSNATRRLPSENPHQKADPAPLREWGEPTPSCPPPPALGGWTDACRGSTCAVLRGGSSERLPLLDCRPPQCNPQEARRMASFALGECEVMLTRPSDARTALEITWSPDTAARVQDSLLGRVFTPAQVAAGELEDLVLREFGKGTMPWYRLGRDALGVLSTGRRSTQARAALGREEETLTSHAPASLRKALEAFLAEPSEETAVPLLLGHDEYMKKTVSAATAETL